MDTAPLDHRAFADRALDIVRAFLGEALPADDAPTPPGPWDPVIRDLLSRGPAFGPHPDPWRVAGPGPQPWRTAHRAPDLVPWRGLGDVFGPQPEPWRLAIITIIARKHPAIWDVIVGGGGYFGDEVALNPQPLPPRWSLMASLAATAALRAETLAELGRVSGSEGGAVRFVSELVDDICGNDWRFRWPFPGPRPNWLLAPVDGVDLVVMAGVFATAAQRVFDDELAQALGDAAARLAETGTGRLG
jgi:hypothetical protein